MLSFDSLLPFGKFLGGVLQLESSVSLTYAPKAGTDCLIVRALSSYSGDRAPRFRIALTADGQTEPFYESHNYCIGKNGSYTRQSWRTPPLFLPGMTLTVHLEVPIGTVLSVKDFGLSQDVGSRAWCAGPRHNAHLGFWGLAPDNTMPAFELAATSGFPSCIVVPKVTLDGVLVCIHDDTINRTARDPAGRAPDEPIYVWDKTYSELMEWEYGSYKNEIYKGAKIPLLSEFFDLCAKTGMFPMFSTHPGLTKDQWKQVRSMLECRGLLKNFHIKSFDLDVLQSAYSIFGTDIDGYTYDNRLWDPTLIDTFKNSGIKIDACRAGIEIPFAHYTEEIAKAITDAGLFAAAYRIKRQDFDEYQRLISWGVTEFTEDYHCSMGLNY